MPKKMDDERADAHTRPLPPFSLKITIHPATLHVHSASHPQDCYMTNRTTQKLGPNAQNHVPGAPSFPLPVFSLDITTHSAPLSLHRLSHPLGQPLTTRMPKKTGPGYANRMSGAPSFLFPLFSLNI